VSCDPLGIRFEWLSAATLAEASDDLVMLLQACVHAGASLGFLAPLSDPEAREYWNSILSSVTSGGRAVIVARDEINGRVVGSGQLAFESKPNGRHRAEVNKIMVLPSHRRRGIAVRVMLELERRARERSVWLLVLDTSEGFSGARALYESLGYTYVGGIPDYALDPDGRPEKNAIYYKNLKG
jgi:ribosomal protein S18 acetylase RimI-like enzyme